MKGVFVHLLVAGQIRAISLVLILCFVLDGCSGDEPSSSRGLSPRSEDIRVGTRFLPPSSFAAPDVIDLKVPVPPSVDAIWGATGRDDQGRIYVGLSSHGAVEPNAYLYRYDPTTGHFEPQGDVLSELHRARGAMLEGGQNKLHSKIFQADDGFLYFSSFDEAGETRYANPEWGGHLWRKRPDDLKWQHLLATPEALIAVNVHGTGVFALGYCGHVLYRFDTETNAIIKVEVGSVPGHVSRNFLVDRNGHAYVPQVRADLTGKQVATLQEYDSSLVPVGEHDLPKYVSAPMHSNQGIVAYTALRDGSIAFLVGKGDLYLVRPDDHGPASVSYLGKMHPAGDANIKNLFSYDGRRLLVSAGRQSRPGSPWEWLIYELDSGVSAAKPLSVGLGLKNVKAMQVYGSLTRDNDGDFYVAGFINQTGRQSSVPVLLRLRVPST
jgi:hypothetical protein